MVISPLFVTTVHGERFIYSQGQSQSTRNLHADFIVDVAEIVVQYSVITFLRATGETD